MKDLVPREAYDVDETGYWKYPEMSWVVAAVTRLLLATRRPSLEVTWPGGVMVLRVPTPSETMNVMNARLAELRGPDSGNA